MTATVKRTPSFHHLPPAKFPRPCSALFLHSHVAIALKNAPRARLRIDTRFYDALKKLL